MMHILDHVRVKTLFGFQLSFIFCINNDVICNCYDTHL